MKIVKLIVFLNKTILKCIVALEEYSKFRDRVWFKFLVLEPTTEVPEYRLEKDSEG
jgi:hypothetical protein